MNTGKQGYDDRSKCGDCRVAGEEGRMDGGWLLWTAEAIKVDGRHGTCRPNLVSLTPEHVLMGNGHSGWCGQPFGSLTVPM
jgi:hypothetical protein